MRCPSSHYLFVIVANPHSLTHVACCSHGTHRPLPLPCRMQDAVKTLVGLLVVGNDQTRVAVATYSHDSNAASSPAAPTSLSLAHDHHDLTAWGPFERAMRVCPACTRFFCPSSFGLHVLLGCHSHCPRCCECTPYLSLGADCIFSRNPQQYGSRGRRHLREDGAHFRWRG